MYCGQCGKKVLENMLFCPFCGSPIVIPDQDEAPAPVAVQREAPAPEIAEEAAPVQEQEAFEPLLPEKERQTALPDRPLSLFDDFPPDARRDEAPAAEPLQENFAPLRFDFDEAEEGNEGQTADEAGAIPDESAPEAEVVPEKPVRRPAAETHRPEKSQKRAVNTYIPIKELSPDDIFMDEIRQEEDYDDDDYDDAYDRRDADDDDEGYGDDFEFEEREDGSFFQRHIRGIVGLILLLVMAVICAVWAFSPQGQLALARMNLAWTAQPYADLGYDAYMQNSDLMAARYYEKALSREPKNYEYAHSAMVAYYEADEIASAAAMLKKCIEMQPDNPEPYQEMLILYPDADSRPWEISELIRLGYQRTGDASLKQN